MTDLTSLTLADARDRLRRREFSAAELANAHLTAMEEARALNAYVLETPDRARAMAQAADARLKAGDARPLEGLALGVKDMFATKDVRTTAGSRILDGFLPSYESTVSANLWRDGAVMLGKLNNDEFAMGSSNETSYFGAVVSPWRRQGTDGKPSDAKLVPGHRGEQDGGVAHRARERPGLVERRRIRHDAPARAAAVGRLDADDAGEGGGLADGTAGVRARRAQAQACGHRRGRTARGTARHERRIRPLSPPRRDRRSEHRGLVR